MQFAARFNGIPEALDRLYSIECDKGLCQPSIALLERTLADIIGSLAAAYIIIDALDECSERRKLLKWMQSITSGISDKLHLMVCSRPEPEICNGIDILSNLVKIDIAGQKSANDIGIYLDARLGNDDRWSDHHKHMIRATLYGGANGM